MNVTGMAEDAQGYMWFGTGGNGLMRYDGSNVVNYTRDYGNVNSLAGNEINFIYPDSSGKLLIGTKGQGLDVYDPATGKFNHFRHAANDSNSLSNDTVTAIMKDREGFIWIGTHGGLNKSDGKIEKFTHYFHNDKDSTSLSNDQVRVIYEDKHGVIWIGTGSPFVNEGGTKGKGGLNRLDLKTGRFIRYLHNPNDPSSLIDNRVGAIFEDQRGVFWIGTAGQGLHTMNREAGTFERHLFDPAHPEKLSRFLPHETRFAADHITFIVDDPTSNIWIGTFAGPLIHYDFEKNKISTFKLSNSKFDSLTGFEIQSRWKASTSSDRIFWISGFGWENLYKVEPLTKPITRVAVNEQINSLFTVNDSTVWIGTQNGLILHDRKRGIVKRIKHGSLAGAGLSSDLISCIGSGSANKLWVGTFGGGVDMIDQKNNAIISYRHNPKNSKSLSNDTVSTVYEDQANNLWVGTTKGLDRMDIATGKFRHFQNDAHDSNGLFIISPTIIYQDEKSLWIGGWGDVGFVGYAGLYQLNLETGKFRHYLHLHRVFSIYADSDKVLWVGTDQGLFQFNRQSDVFSPFWTQGELK